MPLNTPQPANEDEWVTVSLDQNVSLLSSRLAADIARENVKIAFGGHLPTLDVLASKSRTTTGTTEVFLRQSVQSGQRSQRPPIHAADHRAAVQRRTDTVESSPEPVPVDCGQGEQVVQSSRATERQARDAYLGVISGIARVRALRQALESSQTALKATEAGYEVGTRTAVDVLNSRRTTGPGPD